MNCLHMDPNLLVKKIDSKRRDFIYTCFKDLKEFNLPVDIYYGYFLGIEEFKHFVERT